jgi:hypothetical protein
MVRIHRGSGRLSAWLAALASIGCGGPFEPADLPAPTATSWSKAFGDDTVQSANAVTVDAFGNIFVTGSFEGVVDFGSGPLEARGSSDVFVTAYDTDGVNRWSRRFGDEASQSGRAIAVDSGGNILVVGHFDGVIELDRPLESVGADVFVMRLSPDGEDEQGVAFANPGIERVSDAAVDANNDVVIVGSFDGELSFGGEGVTTNGGDDIFVTKVGLDGSERWTRHFGTASEESVEAVAVDGTGKVALTGAVVEAIDFGGGQLLPIGAEPNDDAFVVVLAPGGDHLWSKRLGDEGQQLGEDVAFRPSGALVATGSFQGAIDFDGMARSSAGGHDVYLVEYDANALATWSRSFGKVGSQFGHRARIDREGNIAAAGDFDGNVDFGGSELEAIGTDIYLARLGTTGDHRASFRFGDADTQSVEDVAVDSGGNVIIVGSFLGILDFGFGEHLGLGEDAFVAKLAPP